MISVCLVILQGHVIKGSCDFGQEPIKVSYHSAKFSGHRHCGSGNIMVLIYRVILQDHVIKGSSDSIGMSPSR